MIESEEELEDNLSPEEEAEAAAAEAGSIGGREPEYVNDEGERADEADRAVEEAGGGESEGFEQSEELLERYASHEDRGGNPAADAFTPEDENPNVDSPSYGEADEPLGPDGDDTLRPPEDD